MAKKPNAKTAVLLMDKKWQAESDLDCLMRSCEIKKDKARMKAAQDLAKSRLLELAKVTADEDEDMDE